jgi:hypothetical protein
MRFKHLLHASLLLLVLLFMTAESFGQDNWWKEKKYKTESKKQKFALCKASFVTIGDGFLYSNVFNITPYISDEVYISIMNDDKGYYNQEQGRYILEQFMANYPVASFRWKNSSVNENYSFAVGKYKYRRNGYVSTSTISVSLKYINDTWIIDQIIIN